MITGETSEPEYCTVAEAAALLHVSKPTVWRWIASGRLPAVKRGPRAIRIRRVDLRQLDQPACARRPMTRAELEPYVISHGGDPTRSHEEVMASIAAINKRILERRGGKPFESSVPLIHEARRERDERL